MIPQARPSIPKPVARQLRQLAGFGCCRCGSPILQYHHIVPYSTEAHFRVEDMMVLCPLCHDMVTKGAITLEQQREYQARPYNITRGYADGSLLLNGPYCAVKAGGVIIVAEGALIVVDEQPLLSLTIGPTNQLELSIRLFDKKDRLVAIIDRNEWVSGDVALWDIKADHQKLKVNKKRGQIELDVNAQGDAVTISARLWHKGRSIRLSSTALTFDSHGMQIQSLAFVNARFMLSTKDNEISIVPDDVGGRIISESDPSLRLRKAIEAYVK